MLYPLSYEGREPVTMEVPVRRRAYRATPASEQSTASNCHYGCMDNDVAEILRAKKTEIEQQMSGLAVRPEDPGSIDFGKRVGEGTSIAVDRLSQVAAHDKLQLTLADVDRALEKVEDGTYGTCDVCGNPIGDERLEALPWAVLCVEDAARR